jgi:hypothetical protein
VLSDGNDYGSVVRVGVDGCETVVACWDTGGDIDRDDAVDLGGVNTLEEGERRGVKDSRVVKVTHGLDDEAERKHKGVNIYDRGKGKGKGRTECDR